MAAKHQKRKKSKGRSAVKKERHGLFHFFFGSLFLALPFLVIPQALDRALMPRLLALSLILLPTGLLLFRQRPSREELSVLRQWLFPIIGTFLLVGLLTSFFALNHRESLFGITKTALFLLGTACSALLILRTPGWFDKLSRLAILSSVPALLIGAVQYVQRVVLSDQDFLSDGRVLEYAVTAVMAHKNIYSVFMALLLPFTVFGAYVFRGKWQVAASISSLLMLLMIVLLKTRSAWLGLGFGLFVACLLLIFHGKSFQIAARWRKSLLVALVLFVIALVPLLWIGRTAPEFSIPGRVYSIIDPKSPHNIHRFTAWRSSVEMIRDHPLVGVGPGNWRIKVPYYLGDKDVSISAVNWARPHNDFLWVFAEKGVAGFLLFLAIFWMGLRYLLRVIRAGPEKLHRQERLLALGLASGLTIYLTDSFFSFPHERIEIQVLLFVMLGASAALHHKMHTRENVRLSPAWFRGFTLLACGFGLLLAYQSIMMEVRIHRAVQAMYDENWPKMLSEAKASRTQFRSLDNNGYPSEYFIGLAHDGRKDHQAAITAYKEALGQSPKNVWVLDRLGAAYLNAGQLQEAEKHLLEVGDIIQGVPVIMRNLANIYYSRGQYQKALDALLTVNNWEEDADIANNVRILKKLIESNQ